MKLPPFCILIGLAALFAVRFARADGELVVHEWGTLTYLQDDAGRSIGGINVAAEPVPEFLHETAPDLLVAGDAGADTVPRPARCYPNVTMTADSAVLHFYPSEGFDSSVDVTVHFGLGRFTHYFPQATVTPAPGSNLYLDVDVIRWSDSRGEIRWKEVQVKAADVSTAGAPAWLASPPSESASVEVNHERAKFLFYRGIGHAYTQPLKVTRSGPELVITSPRDKSPPAQLWLADIRRDGRTAFRILRPFNEETFLVRTGHHFAPDEYSGENASTLREALSEAVIAAGLFESEAEALLKSAQGSYFTTPGLRLFFVLPGQWMCPLEIRAGRERWPRHETPDPRGPTGAKLDVKRVTLARVEIVSPGQRALLARMAGSDSALGSDGIEASKLPQTESEWNELRDLYWQLGPFRNALVLEEQKRRPTPRLQAFIEHFRLEAQPASSRLERRRNR